MSIKNVEIKNFTVFNNIAIDFNQGVNVLIGENGTGKTHLMKGMYALSENLLVCEKFETDIGIDTSESSVTLAINLKYYFKSSEINLIKDINSHSKCSFLVDYIRGNLQFQMQFNKDTNQYESVSSTFKKKEFDYNKSNIFIPAKDMLTHSRGFLSMYDKFDMPFDKTYYDIISKSLLLNLKQIPTIGEVILPKLEKIIGGKVVVDNETFFIEKENGAKIEFSVEAEGIKKFAILWQLIMNESITKDSVLFWDEPEANINPKLMKDVVEILLELSRQGVQIFVATHNYIFAKYMEVLAHDTDNVSFHALYKTANEGVQCESHRNFRDLKHNSIISSFDKLLDQVFDEDLGD